MRRIDRRFPATGTNKARNAVTSAVVGTGALLVALATAGCDDPAARAAAARVTPEYDKTTGRLTRIAYDSNGDGKTDNWAYMDGAHVVRVEVDEDGDGKVDRWEYHAQDSGVQGSEVQGSGPGAVHSAGTQGSGAVAGPQGSVRNARLQGPAQGAASPLQTIERIERAARHDGRVSRWEYFKEGQLIRVEEDTDNDGRIDKWETYSGGTLTSMSLDTSGRGTPDRRLLYKPNGDFDRLEELQ